MKARWSRLLAAACVGAWTLSCSHFDRISECSELTKTVNQHMDELAELATGTDSPAKYKKLAQGYAALALEVTSLEVAKGGAAKEVKEYADFMHLTAKSCSDLATALSNHEAPEGPRRELERLARREKALTSRLEAYCQSP